MGDCCNRHLDSHCDEDFRVRVQATVRGMEVGPEWKRSKN